MLWRKTLLRCYLSVRHFLSRPNNLRFLVNRNLFKHARTDESSFSAVSQIENPHYPYPTFLSFDQIDKIFWCLMSIASFCLYFFFIFLKICTDDKPLSWLPDLLLQGAGWHNFVRKPRRLIRNSRFKIRYSKYMYEFRNFDTLPLVAGYCRLFSRSDWTLHIQLLP